MIYHVSDAVLEERFQMRGGNGTVQINNLMPKEGLPAHCRLFATITLQPGCSIGGHVHEDECEIFSFTQGAGRFLDNGNWTPVQAGDVTTTGYGESHSVENTGDGPLVLTAVIITQA